MSDAENQPLVMVVDDDEDFRDMIRDYLKDKGYRVIAASSGPEALRLSENAPPDVVLLDIMMPQKDGYETCRDLRKSNQTKASTIVMLTVKDQLGDKLSAYIAGAHRFISKTADLEEIGSCLNKVLVQRRLNHENIS